jgi:hypothetical protein
MCRVPTPIDPRSMADRVPIAPRSTRGLKPDGRSAGAKRFRALVLAYEAEIGGNLTEAERGLVEQAALLQLRCEQLRADVIAGKPVDDDLLIRLASTSRRALSKITAKAKPAAGETLQEYLAAKAAAAELVDDDEEDTD